MQYPEIAVQAVVLALSLLGGHFVAALLNAAGLALLLRRLSVKKLRLDSLELWKLLPQAKQYTYYKLGIFGASFAFTMFRCAASPPLSAFARHAHHVWSDNVGCTLGTEADTCAPAMRVLDPSRTLASGTCSRQRAPLCDLRNHAQYQLGHWRMNSWCPGW